MIEKVIKKTVVRIALSIVRRFLNKKIGAFTPEDLYKAIQTNTDLWDATPTDLRRKGLQLKKTYKGLYEEHVSQIDKELILSWIKEDHYDLYSTLVNSPGGLDWIDRQILKIKKEILGL